MDRIRLNRDIYPLTIVKDRYNGAYSHGKYTAWNLNPCYVPEEICSSDVECYDFWLDNHLPVGLGDTPWEAVENLEKILKGEKYDRSSDI